MVECSMLLCKEPAVAEYTTDEGGSYPLCAEHRDRLSPACEWLYEVEVMDGPSPEEPARRPQ